jgi:hypothetical protein
MSMTTKSVQAMIFAVVVPIIILFACHCVHWSSPNVGLPYPLHWKVGFALVSACMVSLSLGLIVGTRPLAFSFMIASTYRKAGKSDVAAALSFTPSVFGGIARHLRRNHKLLHRHHHGGSCDPVAVGLHVDPARVNGG